jgi:hypothetical protein
MHRFGTFAGGGLGRTTALNIGGKKMRFPSRAQVCLLVTAATLVVCSLGVRAELHIADNSKAQHRLAAHPAQAVTEAGGDRPEDM